MNNGFFKSIRGNNSSSRLIGFIVVITALVYSGIILFIGKSNVMEAAGAAGLLFTTIAGPAMTFLFFQKKNEIINLKNTDEKI